MLNRDVGQTQVEKGSRFFPGSHCVRDCSFHLKTSSYGNGQEINIGLWILAQY